MDEKKKKKDKAPKKIPTLRRTPKKMTAEGWRRRLAAYFTEYSEEETG